MDTLRFHEPVGASPGPDFVGWTLCDFVNEWALANWCLLLALGATYLGLG